MNYEDMLHRLKNYALEQETLYGKRAALDAYRKIEEIKREREKEIWQRRQQRLCSYC